MLEWEFAANNVLVGLLEDVFVVQIVFLSWVLTAVNNLRLSLDAALRRCEDSRKLNPTVQNYTLNNSHNGSSEHWLNHFKSAK